MGLLGSLFGGSGYENISVADYLERFSGSEHALIDVRSNAEFAEGHLPGAVHIALNTLGDNIEQVPNDKPVVLVCRSGARSGAAARALARAGYENLYNIDGGTIAWARAGQTLER